MQYSFSCNIPLPVYLPQISSFSSPHSCDISDICQVDGNVSQSDEQLNSNQKGEKIPVQISQCRTRAKFNFEVRIPVRKTLRRNNVVLQAIELPVVMNINPRSIYNKADQFKLLMLCWFRKAGSVKTIP